MKASPELGELLVASTDEAGALPEAPGVEGDAVLGPVATVGELGPVATVGGLALPVLPWTPVVACEPVVPVVA